MTKGLFSAAIAGSIDGIPVHPCNKAREFGVAVANTFRYPGVQPSDFAPNLSLAPRFIIGSGSGEASVIEAFGVDPAVSLQKMGRSRDATASVG